MKKTKFKENLSRAIKEIGNGSKIRGITLISLVITIIILLLLSGIAIATLGGENGLFARVKLGKERYAISEAKEKLELEITNLQIEQQGKGEELKKEDLPKMNNDEIDVRDTTNFPVEVIYKNYKFEVDSNFQVTYVGEANETIITYTTEPDGYTNQNKVKVLVTISNPKGIKSILKPGETDKILPQDRTTAGIEFTVTKNGHYILKVEDIDGNEVSKDIYIELIDTIAPGEFTPEIQKADNSITVIENGKDAEATEESCKSGIDHYEYYLIDSSNKETKYDTNKIENLELGSYKLYVIAYDKAGNNRKSNIVDFKISVQFKEMAVGFYHILALDKDNNLWAWGDNEYGQLGDETTTNKASPTKIETGITFVQLSAGYFHSAGIDNDGKLWSWGYNKYGQLGDGTTTQQTKPIKIMGDKTFKKVIASNYSTLAIDMNDEIWYWGRYYGDHNGGAKIPQKLDFKIEYSLISGDSHYLFLDKQNKLWSWGANYAGQIGDGTTITRTNPVQIKPETKFTQVSAGDRFSLAIDEEGNLWSWGYNDDGQLGDGTKTYKTSPVQITKETKFTQVSAGSNHCLAIDNEGNLWSWGRNVRGQLGDGTTTNRLTPQKVMEGIKFKQIYARSSSNLALDSNGNLWSWGYNEYGELGDGTTTERHTPVQIN